MARRTKWELSAGAFEQLLRALSPDREIAGRQYETIREGLLRFFTRRVGAAADTLADQTIDRVCRRIDEGEVLLRPSAYCIAVARNVLREHLATVRRHESLARAAAGERTDSPAALDDDVPPEQLRCLHECLGALSSSERALIQGYYGASGRDVIAMQAVRAALAREMGITAGALRVRAHRLRVRLEACHRACVERTPMRRDAREGGHGD